MKIKELKTKQFKAGIIPFYIEGNDIVRMLFMIPSDPRYGGNSPQIAKGIVEPNEVESSKFLESALREGHEELGLKIKNIKNVNQIWNRPHPIKKPTFKFIVFSAEIKNPHDFGPFHYETGETRWLNNKNFKKSLRKDHIEIVEELLNSLNR